MASVTNDTNDRSELPPKDLKRSAANIIGWGVFLLILVWSWEGADMRPVELIRDSGNMVQFMNGFFPPNFLEWESYLSEMLITLQIAVWGTVLAVVCAIPCGILSAENIAPWWILQPMRRAMDAARAILAEMQLAPFVDSTNAQLYPIRQLALFKDKIKIEKSKLSAGERQAKVKMIEGKLKTLDVLAANIGK